ncbi:DUF167 family protein [Teredinibacter turnerae]|uniref:DUF167 family protein n=1 Tax=Teredinibacter turnerae TaxID=2426 RepID=UPI00049154B0|nr:DUF167 family protein [Teredinibacter turnerae]
MPDHYQWHEDHLILHCVLQPKASSDAFAGLQADRLKIRITAPPTDGKANAHLVKYLARQFGVAKSNIEIVRGQLSRQKTLQIHHPKHIPAGALVEQPNT